MKDTTMNPASSSRSSRRTFLAKAGAAAFGFTIVPRNVLGGAGFTPPSERVTLAGIGAGGMGGGILQTMPKKGQTSSRCAMSTKSVLPRFSMRFPTHAVTRIFVR